MSKLIVKYDCWDCLGKGVKEVFRRKGIDGGVCYTCGGSGKTNRPTKSAPCKHKVTREAMGVDTTRKMVVVNTFCKACSVLVKTVDQSPMEPQWEKIEGKWVLI